MIVTISLPMTKTAFTAIQEKYIECVAKTADVIPEHVKILSVNEVSTRSSRITTGRLLLATSVHVQTSVLVPMGQQARLGDQTALNSNLIKNGLPSGTLVANATTTPGPALVSAASVSTPSNVPKMCMILCIVCFRLSRAS
jgi:hypothetical protein